LIFDQIKILKSASTDDELGNFLIQTSRLRNICRSCLRHFMKSVAYTFQPLKWLA